MKSPNHPPHSFLLKYYHYCKINDNTMNSPNHPLHSFLLKCSLLLSLLQNNDNDNEKFQPPTLFSSFEVRTLVVRYFIYCYFSQKRLDVDYFLMIKHKESNYGNVEISYSLVLNT